MPSNTQVFGWSLSKTRFLLKTMNMICKVLDSAKDPATDLVLPTVSQPPEEAALTSKYTREPLLTLGLGPEQSFSCSFIGRKLVGKGIEKNAETEINLVTIHTYVLHRTPRE